MSVNKLESTIEARIRDVIDFLFELLVEPVLWLRKPDEHWEKEIAEERRYPRAVFLVATILFSMVVVSILVNWTTTNFQGLQFEANDLYKALDIDLLAFFSKGIFFSKFMPLILLFLVLLRIYQRIAMQQNRTGLRLFLFYHGYGFLFDCLIVLVFLVALQFTLWMGNNGFVDLVIGMPTFFLGAVFLYTWPILWPVIIAGRLWWHPTEASEAANFYTWRWIPPTILMIGLRYSLYLISVSSAISPQVELKEMHVALYPVGETELGYFARFKVVNNSDEDLLFRGKCIALTFSRGEEESEIEPEYDYRRSYFAVDNRYRFLRDEVAMNGGSSFPDLPVVEFPEMVAVPKGKSHLVELRGSGEFGDHYKAPTGEGSLTAFTIELNIDQPDWYSNLLHRGILGGARGRDSLGREIVYFRNWKTIPSNYRTQESYNFFKYVNPF